MKCQASHLKIQTIWGQGKAKAKHFAQIRVFRLWRPILVKALACRGAGGSAARRGGAVYRELRKPAGPARVPIHYSRFVVLGLICNWFVTDLY